MNNGWKEGIYDLCMGLFFIAAAMPGPVTPNVILEMGDAGVFFFKARHN